MVARMLERAKEDLDRVLEQLSAIAIEVDRLSTHCANALNSRRNNALLCC